MSSNEHHQCFIKTSSLDGEKNLKKKECPAIYEFIPNEESIKYIVGECEAEKPNSDLYSFLGRLKIGDKVLPLSNDNFIPKGCQLKNTKWIYGLVVYSGW